MGQFTNLTSADGTTFPAYVATPAGKPRGGVVVLQEIFGVNSHIQSVADLELDKGINPALRPEQLGIADDSGKSHPPRR